MHRYAGVVNRVLNTFFEIILRLDAKELNKIPLKGAYILAFNHVGSLEVPVVRGHLHPRDVVGLSKVENWHNPLFKFLFHVWGGVPLERGTVDREAFQKSVDVLKEGRMLGVAPEGTRSKNGQLQQGKPGIVPLALRGDVPIIPIAHWGGELFWENIKHLRRTDFHVRVGRPFRVEAGGVAMSREVRQAITDEIMYRIAELLPAAYRGVYPNPEKVTYQYLKDVNF